MKSIKNKVVALGVVYPGLEEYIEDYFSSLANQTYTYYDVWIFNDGLDEKLLDKYISKYNNLNIYLKKIDNKYTPAEIRELAIMQIKDEYDYLIFTDADDYFSPNRIEKSVGFLQDYDFCYNDMMLVNYTGEMIDKNSYFKNKDNPFIVNNFNHLLSKNFCGLSNTAINLKTINLDFLKIPSSIIAVDWWIFSLFLIKGYKGVFIDGTYTYYRQHESNIVGGTGNMNENELLRGIHIKKEQYKLMLKYYCTEFNSIIEKELHEILTLEEKISEKKYLEKYINYINDSDRKFMWWENIRL